MPATQIATHARLASSSATKHTLRRPPRKIANGAKGCRGGTTEGRRANLSVMRLCRLHDLVDSLSSQSVLVSERLETDSIVRVPLDDLTITLGVTGTTGAQFVPPPAWKDR
jgi:hypothetical protein